MNEGEGASNVHTYAGDPIYKFGQIKMDRVILYVPNELKVHSQLPKQNILLYDLN